MASTAHIRSVTPIDLPIGIDDFAKLIEGQYSFVDKSLLIRDFIARRAEVTLITRPRRFGKTLNLSMLRYFFAPEVRGQPTAGLFADLAIAEHAEAMAHQGKYPVIFVTLKDLIGGSFEAFEASLREKLSELFTEHQHLKDSPHIEVHERNLIDAMLTETASLAQMKNALRRLSGMLYRHYGQKVVILIDEYDAPIHHAYQDGYYGELMRFLRPMMNAALKGNEYLHQGVLTGILRIGGESMFSDLNNLVIHSILDEDYSSYFGFTEAEVAELLRVSAQAPALEEQIKNWYNGYRFSNQVIYNPWSIINCLWKRGELESYWANTSGNDLLKKFMPQADTRFREDLERLIAGHSVQALIDPKLLFTDLGKTSIPLWSLMLFSGYLTALSVQPVGNKKRCELTIPNREILYEYDDIIQSWVAAPNVSAYQDMLAGLAAGDPKGFEAALREYLLACASFLDTSGHQPEKFYHGLILGMMVGLRETHVIGSQRESGYGRSDLALFPKGKNGGVGVVLEFKQTEDREKLQETAEAALAQIDARQYEAELRQHPLERILRIGLAFCGKEAAMVFDEKRGGDGKA